MTREEFPPPPPPPPPVLPPGCAVCGKVKPNTVIAFERGWSLDPVLCPKHAPREEG